MNNFMSFLDKKYFEVKKAKNKIYFRVIELDFITVPNFDMILTLF